MKKYYLVIAIVILFGMGVLATIFGQVEPKRAEPQQAEPEQVISEQVISEQAAPTPIAEPQTEKQPENVIPQQQEPQIPEQEIMAKEPPAVQSEKPSSIEEKTEYMATDPALRNTIENQFKDLLSFPLTEDMMISYVEAARRVQQINDKWDVQIASIASDKAAMEYNNYSVEEITASLNRIPNLTIEQYSEMTRLISNNQDFNRVYQAYRELIERGSTTQQSDILGRNKNEASRDKAAPNNEQDNKQDNQENE